MGQSVVFVCVCVSSDNEEIALILPLIHNAMLRSVCPLPPPYLNVAAALLVVLTNKIDKVECY